jgi:hypothetical protein
MSKSNYPLVVSPAAMRSLAIAAGSPNAFYETERGQHGFLPPPFPTTPARSSGGSGGGDAKVDDVDGLQQDGGSRALASLAVKCFRLKNACGGHSWWTSRADTLLSAPGLPLICACPEQPVQAKPPPLPAQCPHGQAVSAGKGCMPRHRMYRPQGWKDCWSPRHYWIRRPASPSRDPWTRRCPPRVLTADPGTCAATCRLRSAPAMRCCVPLACTAGPWWRRVLCPYLHLTSRRLHASLTGACSCTGVCQPSEARHTADLPAGLQRHLPTPCSLWSARGPRLGQQNRCFSCSSSCRRGCVGSFAWHRPQTLVERTRLGIQCCVADQCEGEQMSYAASQAATRVIDTRRPAWRCRRSSR